MADPADFFADAKKEIEEGDKEYAPVWKPEAGDYLEGIVRDGNWTMTRVSDIPVPVLTIEDSATGDEYTVWCSNTMLKSFIIDNAPKVGNPIVLHYEGKIWNQDKSRQYHKYDARVASPSDFEYWHGKHKESLMKADMKAQDAGSPTPQVVRNENAPEQDPF